ncbi:hypothetical protein BCR32DRAFT_288323 [Anaeromyces robustus]|uniref:Uncharacterized protein n=1 Tax=Anaeromyces robustus TaxID=1754192 RepID=A0A1Y1UZQ6_9FUNG|nr:hypothetical protein BCR32DRAFT_288323 [Anaeromyces robustus]|eukprot:ORX44038.1 hypothetical protein BCR32DRAFT_288323 [Anaeromyces robustus]
MVTILLIEGFVTKFNNNNNKYKNKNNYNKNNHDNNNKIIKCKNCGKLGHTIYTCIFKNYKKNNKNFKQNNGRQENCNNVLLLAKYIERVFPTGGSPTDVVVRLLDSDLLVMSSTPGITLSYGSKYNYLLVIF